MDRPDYTDVTLIKGTDADGNLVTIAVDAAGNIIAVMKGEYAGTLKTLAADDQGRLIAIITDPADVWGYAKQMGMAELATRLGSVATFDKRGDVIWMDDFESGVERWKYEEDVAGGSLVWSPYRAKSGAFSAALTPPPQQYKQAYMSHYFNISVLSKMGFEFSWVNTSHPYWLGLKISLYDRTYLHQPEILCYPGEAHIDYRDENSNMQYLTTNFTFRDHPWVFHTIKLVLDFTTKKYLRLIADDTEFDMSTFQYPLEASSYAPHGWMTIFVASYNATPPTYYIDSAIITTNEP